MDLIHFIYNYQHLTDPFSYNNVVFFSCRQYELNLPRKEVEEVNNLRERWSNLMALAEQVILYEINGSLAEKFCKRLQYSNFKNKIKNKRISSDTFLILHLTQVRYELMVEKRNIFEQELDKDVKVGTIFNIYKYPV